MDSRRVMNRPSFPLTASAAGLAVLVAGAPATAQVYKVVAPDGHITYSDQKPSAEAQNQATVIGSAGSHRPLVPPPPAASGPPKLYLPPPQPADVAAKQGVVSVGRSSASRDLQLVEGLVVARGYEILVQGYLDTCGGTMPSSLNRFDAAARAWRQDNAQLLTQTNNLRANLFSTPQQAAIQSIAQSRADLILGPAKAASTEPRIKWCDASTDLLKSPLLSLGTKAAIVQGLSPYASP